MSYIQFKSLIFILFTTLIFAFSSCKEDEELINISVEEVSFNQTKFLLGDTIILSGDNLHKVNYVHLIDGTTRFECSFLSQINEDYTDVPVDENEIRVIIPYEFQLLGKNLKFDFSILDIYTSDILGEFISEKEIGILTPEIISVSDYEFTKRNHAFVTLKNFKKEYLQFSSVHVATERNREPKDKSIGLDYEFINNDTIVFRSTIYAEVFDFNIYFDYQNSGRSDEPLQYSHLMKIENLKSFINYDVPNDRLYAPGSLVTLSDSLNRGQIFWPSETGELEDELTVGGYNTKIPYSYPGEIPFLMPTDIPFENGDRFEVILAKSKGYYNHDNSHNFIEFVDATYKLTEDDLNYVYFEMNVFYNSQFIHFDAVNDLGDTTSIQGIILDYVENLPNGNFLFKSHKRNLPSGTNDLLLYSWDKKYQLVPGGNISYTSNY